MPDFTGSVTINGHPVIVDQDQSIESYIQAHIPLHDLWPSPTIPRSIPPTGTGIDVFESPYQPLPPCEIGQFQWPANMARYGRALYLVDKDTMMKLATDAWGYVPYEPPDPEAPPPAEGAPPPPPANTATDPFLFWGESSEQEVTLELNTPEVYYTGSGSPPQTKIRVKMLMLLPIRITTASDDVWLLRLVDTLRYENQDALIWPHDPTKKVTEDLIGDPVDDSSLPDAVDDTLRQFADINTILRRLFVNFLKMPFSALTITAPFQFNRAADPCWQWKGNRILEVIDTIVLSTGLRPVYTLPAEQTGTPQCRFTAFFPTASIANRDRLLDATKSPIVGGGMTGIGGFAKTIRFIARRASQFLVSDYYHRYDYSLLPFETHNGLLEKHPPEIFTLNTVHFKGPLDNISIDASTRNAMQARVKLLADGLRRWNERQYDVVFAGFYRPNIGAGVPDTVPSGFDDYICFDLRSGTTRYKSLPQHFYPRIQITGGEENPFAGGNIQNPPLFIGDEPWFGTVVESSNTMVKINLARTYAAGNSSLVSNPGATFSRPFYFSKGAENGDGDLYSDSNYPIWTRPFVVRPDIGTKVMIGRGHDNNWVILREYC
jgi:hypothetical protein